VAERKPPNTPPTKAPKTGIGIKAYPKTAPPNVPPIPVPVYKAIFPVYLSLERLLAVSF